MEFNLLTKKQIKKMKLFKDFGTKAEITDYANNLGGIRTFGYGFYYLKTPTINIDSTLDAGQIAFIDDHGSYQHLSLEATAIGLRPAVPYDELFEFGDSVDISNGKIISGEYPQTKVEGNLEEELDHAIRGINIFETGKAYTALIGNYDVPIKMTEYRYNGEKYVQSDYHFNRGWFKVEPITWLVDTETKLAVSEKILVAGVRYDDKYKMGITNSYKKSNIKKYLDEYFTNELYESGVPQSEIERSEKNKLKYLRDIKFEITSEMLKLELLGVQIKTKLFVEHLALTPELQATLSIIDQQKAKPDGKLKEVETEIEDCLKQDVYDTKVLTKRIS